jgi:hypothetical protein
MEGQIQGTREQGNKGTREQGNKGTREQGSEGTRERGAGAYQRNIPLADNRARAGDPRDNRRGSRCNSFCGRLSSPQVSAKALAESKLMCSGIDAWHGSRYSQGQIPELVANTIPRSSKAALSNCSALPTVLRFLNSINLQPAPLSASAMFAAHVSLTLPAVTLGVAAGFFYNPEPVAWRL